MENKNTTDETFNTVIEPHNHRAIIGFDKNGIPKVLVPVSGHTHKHIDENGNEYEHSHEEVFTEDYRKAVSAVVSVTWVLVKSPRSLLAESVVQMPT